MVKKISDRRVFKFLVGLNVSYQHIRSSVLATVPLPELSKVYSMVRNDEQQRGVHIASTDTLDNSVLAAPRVHNGNRRQTQQHREPPQSRSQQGGHGQYH